MQKIATLIGTREPTDKELTVLATVGSFLCEQGYICRSGGAPGSDQAWEACFPTSQQEIYLPWNGFCDKSSLQGSHMIPLSHMSSHIQDLTSVAVEYFYPKDRQHKLWDAAGNKTPTYRLMQRNTLQVLGRDCNTPSNFVVCIASASELDSQRRIKNVKGGTGQAVRIAYHFGIPVWNIRVPDHVDELIGWLSNV